MNPNSTEYWENKLSSQIINLPPSGIRVFFDIVAQKKGVISLGVGEPDFVTPQVIVNTAIESLRNGYTYYTGNAGLLSLRQAISRFILDSFNVEYNPENEILITVGVSQGIDLALRSVVNPGDVGLICFPFLCILYTNDQTCWRNTAADPYAFFRKIYYNAWSSTGSMQSRSKSHNAELSIKSYWGKLSKT